MYLIGEIIKLKRGLVAVGSVEIQFARDLFTVTNNVTSGLNPRENNVECTVVFRNRKMDLHNQIAVQLVQAEQPKDSTKGESP